MRFSTTNTYPELRRRYDKFREFGSLWYDLTDKPETLKENIHLTKAALYCAESKGIPVYAMTDPEKRAKYDGMAYIYRNSSKLSYIEVKFDMDLPYHRSRVIVHELAHVLAKHKKSHGKNEKELIAESVAYLVMSYFGFQTKAYSGPYIRRKFQSESRRYELAKRHRELILNIASSIITDMDRYLSHENITLRSA